MYIYMCVCVCIHVCVCVCECFGFLSRDTSLPCVHCYYLVILIISQKFYPLKITKCSMDFIDGSLSYEFYTKLIF